MGWWVGPKMVQKIGYPLQMSPKCLLTIQGCWKGAARGATAPHTFARISPKLLENCVFSSNFCLPPLWILPPYWQARTNSPAIPFGVKTYCTNNVLTVSEN